LLTVANPQPPGLAGRFFIPRPGHFLRAIYVGHTVPQLIATILALPIFVASL